MYMRFFDSFKLHRPSYLSLALFFTSLLIYNIFVSLDLVEDETQRTILSSTTQFIELMSLFLSNANKKPVDVLDEFKNDTIVMAPNVDPSGLLPLPPVQVATDGMPIQTTIPNSENIV